MAGAAALLWSAEPNLTAAQVKARLLDSVDPLPDLAGKTVSGGRLNAYNALVPPAPAEIHGHYWYDLDGEGDRDNIDRSLWNQTVFLDTNNNGQLDAGEVSTTTDAYGAYHFTDLAPGTYTVAQLVPSGWQQTLPDRNGSFETGDFSAWQGLGTTTVRTASYGATPTDGNFQALLTNQGSGITDTTIAAFLGLAPGQLDGLGNGNATAGSAIKQTVTVSAGTQMTLNWNFLTNEGTPTVYNDFAFVAIAGTNGTATVETLANTNSSFQFSSTPFGEETGYQTFSHTFTEAGTYTLGLGVMDVRDTVVDSGVLLDAIEFEGTVTTAHTITVGSGESRTDVDFAGRQPVIEYGTTSDDVLQGTAQINTLHGLAGDDVLLGQGGDDYLFGGDGEDELLGGKGNDHLFGGKKDDRLFGNRGRDLLNGGGGNDFLSGDAGSDALRGGFGNDHLQGGNGQDELWGESGNDTLIGGNGQDLLSGGEGHDVLHGDRGHDVLLGGAQDDQIFGGQGKDQLDGGSGNDHLFGGQGKDQLRGGSGLDHLWGGQGKDMFVLAFGEWANTIYDFSLNQDVFGLADGLNVGQLEISQVQNHAVIKVAGHVGRLATIQNTNAADLVAAQDDLFVTV
ncbi:MAG: hypothetical protein F6J87_31120 [Spirulina sp. SIO3F2]|nr:hypothetical protein [Spirulina sp. SIO3F2]